MKSHVKSSFFAKITFENTTSGFTEKTVSTLLKWSLKYLSEYLIKRDFSWVSEMSRGSEICRYTKEAYVGYHWKCEGLKVHRVCIDRWKERNHTYHDHEKFGRFFENIFYFIEFFTKNHANLLITARMDICMLWGQSIRF